MLRLAGIATGLVVLFYGTGCGVGDAMTGVGIGKNVLSKNSHLKVWLDGKQAKQNSLKKAATGYSNWTIKDPVSSGPTIKYQLDDPERFGRITMVAISIHQEFRGDYSHQAEYTIVSRDQSPEAQFKHDTELDLGNPGSAYKVYDVKSQEVSGVKLTPGLKYSLQLTVKADKSETASIEFKAN